jgi:putative sterol carrier protein
MDDESRKRLKAKVMMQGMMFGVAEVAKQDPDIQRQLENWDRVIQYRIGAEGPDMYFVVRGGVMQAFHGRSEEASATIQFADVETALAVFTRKLEPQAAFMQGKVQLKGDVTDAMKIGMITQLAQPYFL